MTDDGSYWLRHADEYGRRLFSLDVVFYPILSC
jgi:hypothetical protein